MIKELLFVVYENDGVVLKNIADKITKLGKYKCLFLFADEWSIYRNHDSYIDIKSSYDVFDLRGVYSKWLSQKNSRNDKQYYYTECENLVNTSIVNLLLTDHILFECHHARKNYYGINELDSVSWLYEVLFYLKSIYSGIDMVTVGNNYLIKNILFHFSKEFNSKFYTLLPTRIESTSYWHSSFGLGKQFFFYDEDNYKRLYLSSQEYVKGIENSLYSAPSLRLNSVDYSLKKIFSEYFRFIKINLIFILKDFKDILSGKWRLIYTTFSGKFFYKFLGFPTKIFRNRLKIFFKNIFDDHLPEKFILMPLHVLPESSTLTYGHPYFEISELEALISRLPKGINIVVKENPEMIGLREISDYNRIKKLPRVYLLGSKFNSKNLIHKSVGVIGVSGTALLEANILGKPAYALGKPDFISGYENNLSIDEWLNNLYKNKYSTNISFEKYFENISGRLINVPYNNFYGTVVSEDFTEIITSKLNQLISEECKS